MASFSLAVLVSFAVMGFANGQLRVCYYSNWSQYRPAPRQFFPADIDPFLCSHMIFAFAQIKEPEYELTFFEWNDDKLYRQFNDENDPNSLKSRNPNIKTLLATGGWNAGSEVYSIMAADEGLRKKFAKKAVKFLRKWGFDGLDMDWEYPASRGGRPEDKTNFILLLKDLMTEINKDTNINPGRPRLLLTAAVSAGKSTIDAAYDIPEMAKYLDFINLMTYDFHGAWEDVVGHHSPLYARPSENVEQATLNMDWAARYWKENEAPKEKLIIGLATYGRSFTLRNPGDIQIGAPSAGPGKAGQYTRESGFLAYYEICTMLYEGANRYWEPDQKVRYLVSGDQWVGYEDEESILLKLEYIKQKGYGGAMVWNVDLDDFNKLCRLSNRPYPLMSLIREVFDGDIPPSTERPTGGSTDTTTPHHPDEFCKDKADGYYPDPEDCRKYYQCATSMTYVHTCSEGLFWNPDENTCDWPSNVDCGDRPVPPGSMYLGK